MAFPPAQLEEVSGEPEPGRGGADRSHVSHKRADLQGMRAIAVLTVFANHLFGWPPGGFVGVDVFFVLSGFFITGLLIRERETTRAISFSKFYIRRVKRILPSALLVLVVTTIGSYIILPAARAAETLLDALYAAVFVSNFRFEAVGADYFQQGQPPSPLQHYWSLSIEEQFYFLWPALLAAVFAGTRRLRRRGIAWAGHWGLLVVMTVVVFASFGWAIILSASNPNSAYFSSLARVWELGVGALAAILGPWLTRIPETIRPALAYLGLSGVIISLFAINSTDRFPAPWAALPVLSTAVVVASFHGSSVRSVPLLTNSVARWFGDRSYTLYLWHWPVIVLLLALVPRGAVFYMTAAGLSLGLTAITYRFYEDPIRQSNWLLDAATDTGQAGNRPVARLSVNAWASIGALVATAAVVLIASIHYDSRLSETRQSVAAAVARDANAKEGAQVTQNPCFGAPAMMKPDCALYNPQLPLEPSIDAYATDSYKAALGDCYRNVPTGKAIEGNLTACTFGSDSDDAVRIAFVGDSHAAQLTPALWPILDSNKWRLTTYLGTTCHLAEPAPTGCRSALSQVTAELVEGKYDLLLVSNFNQGLPEASYEKAWAPVSAAGTPIAVISDNPHTTEDAIACLTRAAAGPGGIADCGSPRSEAFPATNSQAAAAVAVGASVIDLSGYYCTDDFCPSVIGNVIVYRDLTKDNSHITSTFAATLAPAVEAGIQNALLPR